MIEDPERPVGDRKILVPDTAIDLGDPEPGPEPAPKVVTYDPSKDRESMRGTIALALIGIFAATIAGAFALVWIHPDRSKELHELLGLVLGPLVALVGAATGYYFGSQAKA